MATAKCVVPGGLSPLGVGPSGTHQWEVVDGSLDSLDKALQAVSSDLPDKVAHTATVTVRRVFLTSLEANADGAIWNAAQVCKLQEREEELEQRIWTLEPEMHGEEASVSRSEETQDSDDEHYDAMGPCLLVRPACVRR